MKSTNAVLEAYAGADEEQRLYLFLSHRECRQEFMEIDLGAGPGAQAESEKPKASQRRGASLRRAAACCWGWFGVGRS